MKKNSALFFCVVILISCGSAKNAIKKKESVSKIIEKKLDLKKLDSNYVGENSTKTQNIIKAAENYIGVPYKYAGTTSAGFDCSGFTGKVFEENGEKLPRRSEDQSNTGKEINVKNTKPGDLLFFATASGSKVSHVGIVHHIEKDGEIKFIHASTSKGVMISSLNDKYWNKAFLFARRVL